MPSATRSRTSPPAAGQYDAYTTLLAVSLGAMLLGIILLALDYMDYGDTKPPDVPKAAVAVRQPPAPAATNPVTAPAVNPGAAPAPPAPVPVPAAPTQPAPAAPK